MIKKRPIIVIDLETGGLDTETCEVVQLAAKAYDWRTLRPLPDGEFNSYAKPLDLNNLSPQAMAINKIPLETLEKAPDLKSVFTQYVKFIQKYNPKGDDFMAPAVGGKNIKSFDLPIINRLLNKYAKGELLFNRKYVFDLEDELMWWFENSEILPNHGMDSVRKAFGLSTEGAHDALVDVRQEGDLIMRFLKLQRSLLNMKTTTGSPLINFGLANEV